MIIFDNSHNNFLLSEYFIDFLCERWIPCQASASVLCLHYRPETVHCSTKDVYTSEITFLALQPCRYVWFSSFRGGLWNLPGMGGCKIWRGYVEEGVGHTARAYQYSVWTQVVSRTLPESCGILFEPFKRLLKTIID